MKSEDAMHEQQLSKRERQIMDVVYTSGRAAVEDVLEGMANPPSRSAVRTFLRILEIKGFVRHEKNGKKYIYIPTQPRRAVGKSAFRRVLDVFYGGSLEGAVAAHLLDPKSEVSGEELERLSAVLKHAKKRGE